MKTPLCEFCLQTSELCSGCQHRLESGKMREVEVMLSRVLEKNREKLALQNIEFTRAYDCGNIIYLFTSTNAGFLIGRGGKVISALIKDAGKHTRVVHETDDFHAMVEEVLRPVKPTNITSVFHDGKEVTKIVISKRFSHKMPAKTPEIEKLLNELAGKKIKIAFE